VNNHQRVACTYILVYGLNEVRYLSTVSVKFGLVLNASLRNAKPSFYQSLGKLIDLLHMR